MLKLDAPVHDVARAADCQVIVHNARTLPAELPRLGAYCDGRGPLPLSRHPGWLAVFQGSLCHTPYCLEAVAEGRTRGLMALCYVRSLLFGRYLISLPYVNYGG